MAQRSPRNQYEEIRRPVTSGSPKRRKRRRKKSHKGLIALLVILVVLAAGVVVVLKTGILNKTAEVLTDTRPLPAEPEIIKTATVGATGDILLHMPVVNAYETADGGYDFSNIFSVVAPVYQQNDLMIANLEVTLGGLEYGPYTAYPSFNSPDEIVPALKDAGVDICLTANNHSNDTGYAGMMRTLDVLDSYGIDHLGTRKNTDEKYLMIRQVNGIKLGMICYTYDTREYTDGELSLNVVLLSDEAARSINTFSYSYLDEFYDDIRQQLYYMDMLGVDVKMVFLHWGQEYEDYPNADQQAIAQRLCDMGVDVIIGGHPHVIQEFDTLTAADGHQMICLYSMGNQLSNQRAELMDPEEPRGYTEDGLVIEVTMEKFNNGKVKVGAVNIVPTWVDGYDYQIMVLDESRDPYSWGASDAAQAIASYNRTMGRLGEGYISYRALKHQSEVTQYID